MTLVLVTFRMDGIVGRETVDRGYSYSAHGAATLGMERLLIAEGFDTHDCGCCLAQRPSADWRILSAVEL